MATLLAVVVALLLLLQALAQRQPGPAPHRGPRGVGRRRTTQGMRERSSPWQRRNSHSWIPRWGGEGAGEGGGGGGGGQRGGRKKGIFGQAGALVGGRCTAVLSE